MNRLYKKPRTINATEAIATDYELILPEETEPLPSPDDQYYDTTYENLPGSGLTIYGRLSEIAPAAGDVGTFTVLNPSLNMIQLGFGYNKRQSPRILVTRIQLRLLVYYRQNFTDPNIQQYPENTIELSIWLDTKCSNSTLLNVTSLAQANQNYANAMYDGATNQAGTYTKSAYDFFVFPNRTTQDQYRRIWRRVHTWNATCILPTTASPGIYTNAWALPSGYSTLPYSPAPGGKYWEADLKDIQIPIDYDDTIAQGTLGQLTRNNLFLTAKQSAADANANFYWATRITFKNLN